EQDVARRQYSTIQITNIFRPTLVNSFRFAYNRTYQNFDDVLSDPRAEKLSFLPGEHFGTISFGSQGLSTNPLNFLGVDNGAPRIYHYNLFQYGDDLTYVKGAHSLKWVWITGEFRTTSSLLPTAGATTRFRIFRASLP